MRLRDYPSHNATVTITRWLRLLLFGVLTVLPTIRQAAGLDPHTQLNRYARQTWSTENGLPQNSVHVLLQTSDGFLWLGTEAGLGRFDGYQIKAFDRNSEPALPDDDVRCLLEDRTGGLWVGTGTGLTILRDGGARSYASTQGTAGQTPNGLPKGAIKALVPAQDGNVWVLTTGGLALASASVDQRGRLRFSQQPELAATNVLSILSDGGDGLWVATDHGMRHITHGHVQTAPGAPGMDRIDAMAEVHGVLRPAMVVATAHGLFRLEDGGQTTIAGADTLPSEGVKSLVAENRDIWAAGRNSVMLFQGAKHLFLRAGMALPGTQISTLLEDRSGAVWIGTNGGVARYFEGKIERVPDAGDSVLSLFEDRAGDLWTGSETDGVRVLRDRAFQTLGTAAQSPGAAPTSVVQTAAGELWVGSNGAGVLAMNHETTKHYTEANGLASDTVLALAPGAHPSTELWVGTSNGLSLLRNGRWRTFTSADGLADDTVRSLLTTHDGSLLIGTPHGLTRLRNGRALTTTENGISGKGPGSNLIGPLTESSNGDTWIGTFGGLTRLRNGVFRNFTTADGLPGNTVTALAQNAGGGIWIGTKGQGLARWNGKTFSSFAAARSIPGEIYAVLDDTIGSLWMTSEHGIFRVAIRDLNRMSSDASGGPKSDVPVVSYGTADGLPSVDTAAIGYPSAWRLTDGRLCFVTRRGVVIADPGRTRRNELPPPVVLEEVAVDDRVVTPGELASMAAGPLHFTFTFAGINLSVPQRVEYRYLLEGLDRDWVYAGNRRVAFYTNIPHGRYRFKVSARNELGAWSAPAEIRFELRPHFYQTLWFRVLLVLLVLLLGIGIYAARVRTLRNRFNLVGAERNRLAREIHDTLAQSFVAVSTRLEVMGQMLKMDDRTLQKIDGVERCREQLDQTRTLVRESLEEARRSIWDLRSEGAEAQTLPARLARVIQDATASVKGARLETIGTFRALERRLEDELFRIAQEAVANAVRHSAARSIRLRLSYELEALRLEVIDDGSGFDSFLVPAQGEGHFGLTGIRERANLIGAEFMLRSVRGEGTTVEITVPLNKDDLAGKRQR